MPEDCVRRSPTLALMGVLLVSTGAGAAVPMERSSDGHDTVPVFVDGRGPYPFILDTGADTGGLYQWFIDELRLAPRGAEQTVSGQTGDSRVRTYAVGDVALDGRHLRHVGVFGFPNRRDSGREAGVLGNDFMDGALVAFDFPCRRVEIDARRADFAHAVGPGPGPVRADQGVAGVLTLPVSVNGFAGEALLDTGSRTTRLTSNFAKGAGIDPGSGAFQDGAPIFGTALTKMVPRDGPVGTVRFGGVEVRDVRAEVIDLPALKDDFKGRPAMILGVDLLGRYRLLYDHKGRRVWLRPSQCGGA